MALGRADVAQLQREISSREFAEWLAFYRLEPFGEERADLRMAVLAALIANVNRNPKKRRVFTPEDFMPKFEPPSDSPRGAGGEGEGGRQTWQQQKSIMQRLTPHILSGATPPGTRPPSASPARSAGYDEAGNVPRMKK